jgi:hypothetical protein
MTRTPVRLFDALAMGAAFLLAGCGSTQTVTVTASGPSSATTTTPSSTPATSARISQFGIIVGIPSHFSNLTYQLEAPKSSGSKTDISGANYVDMGTIRFTAKSDNPDETTPGTCNGTPVPSGIHDVTADVEVFKTSASRVDPSASGWGAEKRIGGYVIAHITLGGATDQCVYFSTADENNWEQLVTTARAS